MSHSDTLYISHTIWIPRANTIHRTQLLPYIIMDLYFYTMYSVVGMLNVRVSISVLINLNVNVSLAEGKYHGVMHNLGPAIFSKKKLASIFQRVNNKHGLINIPIYLVYQRTIKCHSDYTYLYMFLKSNTMNHFPIAFTLWI